MSNERLYIALYRGKSPLSKVIRWATWSRYSHAAIVLMDDDKVLRIIEAWYKGGVIESRAFVHYHTPNTAIDLYEFRKELTDKERWEIIVAAQNELGKPYDWRGVLSFALRRRMQKPGSWFCSELVCHCCRFAGRLIQDEPDWKTSPGGIASSPVLRMAYHLRA